MQYSYDSLVAVGFMLRQAQLRDDVDSAAKRLREPELLGRSYGSPMLHDSGS